jgi:hypothetical protein
MLRQTANSTNATKITNSTSNGTNVQTSSTLISNSTTNQTAQSNQSTIETNQTSTQTQPTLKTQASESAVYKVSNSYTPATTGTNVFKKYDNATNAIGIVQNSTKAIRSLPDKVTSCDQIILVKVKRLKDFEDFCQVEEAFFSLSVYVANLFDTERPDRLLESMTLDKIQYIPHFLTGAKNCLDFLSRDNARMGVCFDNKEQAESAIQAYDSFSRCRLGDDLHSTKDQIKKIIEMSCLGVHDISHNQKKLIQHFVTGRKKYRNLHQRNSVIINKY